MYIDGLFSNNQNGLLGSRSGGSFHGAAGFAAQSSGMLYMVYPLPDISGMKLVWLDVTASVKDVGHASPTSVF